MTAAPSDPPSLSQVHRARLRLQHLDAFRVVPGLVLRYRQRGYLGQRYLLRPPAEARPQGHHDRPVHRHPHRQAIIQPGQLDLVRRAPDGAREQPAAEHRGEPRRQITAIG
jgi:hypothetical protein